MVHVAVDFTVFQDFPEVVGSKEFCDRFMVTQVHDVFELLDLLRLRDGVRAVALHILYADQQAVSHLEQDRCHRAQVLIRRNIVDAEVFDRRPSVIGKIVDRGRQAEQIVPIDWRDERAIDCIHKLVVNLVGLAFFYFYEVAVFLRWFIAECAERRDGVANGLRLLNQGAVKIN